MDDRELAELTAMTKHAVLQSKRAIQSLVSRTKGSEERLRESLDLIHQTHALAEGDPIAEQLAATMIRAALDQVRSSRPPES